MKEFDVTVLLRKAEELKALFVLGQRVIPFLEEIFMFVRDIKPLLDEINVSIEENIKKMPNASKQLSKVTEATELATTEIMDIVDGLVYKTDIVNNNLKRLNDINSNAKNSPNKIMELILTTISGDKDLKSILPELNSLIEAAKVNSNSEFADIINHTTGIINSINEDSSSIMMSLQVQDITSQQIAAVNHLLETIQGKLGKILRRFQSQDMSELLSPEEDERGKSNITTLHRDISFDPDAIDSISNKGFRQDNVDDMVASHKANEASSVSSQDDIDALFSATSQVQTSTAEVLNTDINNFKQVKETENDFDHFSQDDIDMLFGK
jgi:chemotaxis regulatin CheY-phosphate phosphatase CheZ